MRSPHSGASSRPAAGAGERDDRLRDACALHPPALRASVPEGRPAPAAGLVLVDAFCPYHGRYLAEAAQDLYGAGVVHVTSEYMTRYLWMRREERQGGRWRFLSPWLGCSASPTRILWRWRS